LIKHFKIVFSLLILVLFSVSFLKKDIIFNHLKNYNFFLKISSEMVVNEVWVTGLNFEEKENIISSLQFKIGDPVYSINLEKVKNRINKLDWINNAKVLIYPYGVVEILIEEYEPFAIFDNSGKYFLINDKGYKFLEVDKNNFKNFFLVSGKDSLVSMDELKKLFYFLDNLNIKINRVVRIDSRRWDLYLKKGLLIKLPAEKPFLVLNKFINLDFNKIDYTKISFIDLRIPNRIIINNK